MLAKEAVAYLRSIGWQEERELGQIWFKSPNWDWAVEIVDDDDWELSKFDDSDGPDGVAEPRYLTVAGGETLAELRAALEVRKAL